MKKLTSVLSILFLVAALLTSGCGPTTPASAAVPSADSVAARPVEVASVETDDIALVLNYAGKFRAQQEVTLVPRVSGQIKQVLVVAGDRVKAGDPIAIIEDDVYAAKLQQAQGALSEAQLTLQKMNEGTRPEQLAAAKSAQEIAKAALADAKDINGDERTAAAYNLANAQAAVKLAQSEYDKIAWAGQIGQTPQALKLEQATNAYEAALAAYNLQTNPSEVQLASLQAQVVQADLAVSLAEKPFKTVDFDLVRAKIQQAQAVVKLAQLQMDYTTVRAPFDGVVVELYVHQGSLVSPDVPTPMAKVLSNQLEAVVNVEENRLAQIAVGQPVGLKVSAYPGQEFPGAVTSIAAAADDKTHTFEVKIAVQDDQNRLRSGMYANASILLAEKQATLLVPIAALVSTGGPALSTDGQSAVYVVSGDTVALRSVTTGLSNERQVEVLSGLQAGDQVVITGQSNLQDGAKVKIASDL